MLDFAPPHGSLRLWQVNILNSIMETSTDTFFTASAGFHVPDDRMMMPDQVNFTQHVLRANSDAVPASFTMSGVQANEFGFSCMRFFPGIHIAHFEGLGGQAVLSTHSIRYFWFFSVVPSDSGAACARRCHSANIGGTPSPQGPCSIRQ